MKNIFKIMLTSGLALTLTSCGVMNDPFGNNNPNNYPNNYPQGYPNDGRVYRSPDGSVYRQGEVYRDRSGNVYQDGRVIRSGDVYGRPGVLSGNGGAVYPRNNQNLPPGQAKKVYGGSAKDYAPGQVKKRNGNWDNDRWDDDDHKHNKNKNKKYKNKNKK